MQGNGRNLARQGQPRHLRLHPLLQKLFVKLAKRSLTTAGAGGRTLKQVFQIVVVVQVQAPNEHRLFAALQLTVDEAIVGAAARLQPQPAVGPELPLAAEAIRRLHPPQQQRDPYRSEPRNRAQPLRLVMLAALLNQILTGVAAQLLQQDRAPDRAAGRGAATRCRPTAPATLPDAAIHTASCRHRQSPGCDTALSAAP